MARFTNSILVAVCLSAVIMPHITAALRERHHHRRIATTATAESSDETNKTPSTSIWAGPEMALLRRLYDDCSSKNDFIVCLKQKALTALTRAVEKDSIKIVDGLVFEKQNQTDPVSLLNTITDARSFSIMSALDQSLLTKADQLIRTHALKVDMGTGRDGKKKKGHKKEGHIKYVIAALVTAMGIAGPLGLKALAAVAIKALVISKVALTIAGIIALKKLFSNEHGEETSFQVHAGEHNRRSTFVIRPVKSNGSQSADPGVSPSTDPYRYYYEYH